MASFSELRQLLDQRLAQLSDRIEEYAVQIVDQEGMVAWGKLRRGIRTKYNPAKTQIDVFVEASIAPYAQYVHEGRKPGKMPPIGPIEEWARKKRLLSASSRGTKIPVRTTSSQKLNPKQQKLADRYHSLAWAIARKMKSHELKPRRFLIQAIIKALNELK